MKQILTLLIICTAIFSCKEKKEEKPIKDEGFKMIAPSNEAPEPKTYQTVWHEDDGYHLYTYTITSPKQVPFPSYKTISFDYEERPKYDHEIVGSFEYIKANKSKEYQRAYKYVNNIPDSVKMLNELNVSK